jgi:hypothetical protein
MIRLFFIGLLLIGKASSAQLDTIKPPITINLKDTIKTVISIRDPANVDIRKQAPLIIVNNKRFSHVPINQLFLEMANIEAVNVINPANDSVKLFGSKAKNGVIILTTKNNVDWLTPKQIIKQYAKGSSRKSTLFIVDGASFDGVNNLYFEKNNIVNVEVQDSTATLNNKKYSRTIKIKTKGNGT